MHTRISEGFDVDTQITIGIPACEHGKSERTTVI